MTDIVETVARAIADEAKVPFVGAKQRKYAAAAIQAYKAEMRKLVPVRTVGHYADQPMTESERAIAVMAFNEARGLFSGEVE